MKNEFLIKYRLRIALILFLVPFICATFWYLVNTHCVYEYALVGAIFELVWLPMILITFGAPIVSFVCWLKDKRKFKSVFLPICLSTVLVLIWIVNL
jgi:hypothetical protein